MMLSHKKTTYLGGGFTALRDFFLNTILDKTMNQGSFSAGVLALDLNGFLLDVNSEFLAMSGYTAKELIGTSINNVDGSAHHELFVKEKSSFGHYHSILTRKDGSKCPIGIYYFYQQFHNIEKILLFIQENNAVDIVKDEIIKKIFDHSHEAIIVTDNKGFILQVNKSFSDITGYSPEEVTGKTPAILNSGKQDKNFYIAFWRKIIEEGFWQGEIWNKRKNGEIYPEWLNINSIRDDSGDIVNYICQFNDITNRKKSEEELHFSAYHDSLTSLPNRDFLFEKLNHLCDLHQKKPSSFAVLFCDLDRFKIINDTLGHDVGDELLKSVASRLEAKLRENDIIARTGGDEFIVIIEGEKSIKNLDAICFQIRDLFSTEFKTKYGEFKTTISIGVSRFPNDSLDIRELISFADIALSKVKKTGGNGFSFFDIKEKTFIQQRLELEKEIFNAIEKDQFEVWYQPQINTKTYEVYGLECLIRWNHPVYGLIRPDLFIPIAEANGSIKELGHFVLQTACHQLRQWRINNVFTGVMAINISLRQFERNDLLGQVRKILIDEMLPAECIELEVTESLFSEDNNIHTPILCALRELGVKVAIDDFGTGYSSLQRLKNLPIDNVKIDKCFIDNVESCSEDIAIVMAIILLSKTFNVDVIAEGIETQAQADKLTELGCYNQQGYLYSKPANAHDFEAWIAEFTLKHKNKNKTKGIDKS